MLFLDIQLLMTLQQETFSKIIYNGIKDGNTSQLIFDIPTIINDLTKGITLYPGDTILTGTPAGVGAGFTPPKYLNDGDVVECVIENIGTLSNIIK